ncbi:MAG: class I SAM-dependent DNA methyltransferase, partial [Desulfobaccales bacterium]
MDFEKEAASWDAEPRRVKLANDVAAAIIREIKPTQDLDVLEVGCGTGLVTLRLQPLVRSITGVDSSPGMLAVFRDKVQKQGLTNVRPQLVDLEQGGRV